MHSRCGTFGLRTPVFAIRAAGQAHAARNPLAVFREPTTVEVLLAGAPIYADLSKLQCCPPTCDAAAAVVVSADHARRKGLMARSVAIAGQALTTDAEPSFADGSMIAGVGADMTRRAARQACAQAVKSLREIVAQERATLQAKDEVAFSRAAAPFHRRLIEPTGNRPLILLLNMLTHIYGPHISTAALAANMRHFDTAL